MVNGDEVPAVTPKKTEEKPLAAHGEKVIAPPTETKEAGSKEETDKADKPVESPEVDAAKDVPADEAEAPISDDAAEVDAIAEQAGANKKKGAPTEEEKKRQETINKLIEEKKYFIPIKVASRKRRARWNLVILVILLLAVGGYLSVDAGLVGANISLPINFIRNSTMPTETTQQTAVPVQTPVPQPTNNTYISKVDGLKLTYPLTWQKSDKTVAGSPEYLELKPKTLSDISRAVSVELNRGDDPSRTTVQGTTLKQVTYTDVPTSSGQKLYFREIIYSNAKDGLSVRAGLTDLKGTEKAGQPITVLDTAFTALDGKTKIKFNAYTITSNNGKAGFESLEAAQKYMTTNKDYQDAKSILMSLRFK